MKNQGPIIIVVFCLTLFSNAEAQSNCSGSFTEYILNSNNIRASFFPRGNKFTDGNVPGFIVPYPAEKRQSTIFASSPWIAGFDDAGNMKMAAETYANPVRIDYAVGPLSSIGTPMDSICHGFDRAWNVYYEDIKRHRMDFEEDGIIDDTLKSIFGWPAKGNKFFADYYGFELPFDFFGLAEFLDYNGNGLYDPDQGDHPIINAHFPILPDQILWMVFNDMGEPLIPGTSPLRFEIQFTAFAFHCEDNNLLNNTIFNSYKVINRALDAIDSVFFGMWTDYDLGCALDDFIGSDSARRTEFVYNADALDGDLGNMCSYGAHTYGSIPPVQSMTYLSHPMHSFILADHPPFPARHHIYNLLNGLWSDGTPIRPEGDGHSEDPEIGQTKFLFHGDPRDSTSWSANHVSTEPSAAKTISSVFLGRLDPGKFKKIEMAYTFHHEPGGSYFDQIAKMYNDVDSLLTFPLWLWNYEPCTHPDICLDADCVWPGDFDHNGIVDHRDLLYWGVMKDNAGNARNGLVSWRGHYADPWANSTGEGLNFKHGDGNGDGYIDNDDLLSNFEHFRFANELYKEEILYPEGPELALTSDPMDASGNIRNVRIFTNRMINNLAGIAYELEYDTSIYILSPLVVRYCPVDSSLCLGQDPDQIDVPIHEHSLLYAFAREDHKDSTLPSNTLLHRFVNGFRLKSGINVPDSTVFRLRNLTAVDKDGNKLDIGAHKLVVYKDGTTSMPTFSASRIFIYPNPVKDDLYVQIPHDATGAFYNLNGQLVKTVSLTHHAPVDISDFLPGQYYLRIPAFGAVLRVVIH